MSALHTPWIVSEDDDSDFFLVGPDSGDGLVCSPVFRTHDEKLARLIAAAPDLLELLSIAVELLKKTDPYPGQEDLLSECISLSTAVIAKAGGAA